MRPIEKQRARALLAALQDVEEGPNLVGRVRARQDAILSSRRRGQRGAWLPISEEELRLQVDTLGGVASTARHLGIVPTTIRRWRLRGRIPVVMASRIAELIAGGAKSKRKPNRGIDRHYVDR